MNAKRGSARCLIQFIDMAGQLVYLGISGCDVLAEGHILSCQGLELGVDFFDLRQESTQHLQFVVDVGVLL